MVTQSLPTASEGQTTACPQPMPFLLLFPRWGFSSLQHKVLEGLVIQTEKHSSRQPGICFVKRWLCCLAHPDRPARVTSWVFPRMNFSLELLQRARRFVKLRLNWLSNWMIPILGIQGPLHLCSKPLKMSLWEVMILCLTQYVQGGIWSLRLTQ